jgi:hypothetical protein
MEEALARFGWTCSDEFWRRYHSDPWVFHLANAVERLHQENERLQQNAGERHSRLTEIARADGEAILRRVAQDAPSWLAADLELLEIEDASVEEGRRG